MDTNRWYKIPVNNGISGDGGKFHIYASRGSSDNLCLFFAGGGVVWDEYTAARPVTALKALSGHPTFYWNNLRSVTTFMNIQQGITAVRNPLNPFCDWNIVVISYSTGDFHLGNGDFPYKNEAGEDSVLHCHGFMNTCLSLDAACRLFPSPEKILIAGDSAGGFAVPAFAGIIREKYYPDCSDITLFSDSSILKNAHWAEISDNVWHAPDMIRSRIKSDNLILDLYRNVYENYGESFRYLFAGSSRDQVLSAYQSAVNGGDYVSNESTLNTYHDNLCDTVHRLEEITMSFRFFIYDKKLLPLPDSILPDSSPIPMLSSGTVHTAVRNPLFITMRSDGVSMAEWLHDAVTGDLYSAGRGLIS
ncbi:Pectinacetylesterase [Lachnospiraceae bacterium]|nr:Pectinacetylesterase [Lachnospiraceae bacterium]